MKKMISLTMAGLVLAASPAYADRVRDWHDIDKVHNEVLRALDHMEKAQAANHYDMGGHAAKAEADLRSAEGELRSAVEFVKHDTKPQR